MVRNGCINSTKQTSTKKKGIYYAKYRAKNGFGGYGEEDVYFDGDILNPKSWMEIGE